VASYENVMTNDFQEKWTTALIDVGDGAGDALFVFPDELLKLLEWVEGDELNLEIGDNSIIFTKTS